MSAENITAEEVASVFPKVAQTIADCLGRDLEEVKLNSGLINDLEAESIDSLDIVFRLERAFKIKIPRGKIVEEARGELSETEFEQNGALTEAGQKRLREYLSEVPAQQFDRHLKTSDIPALFTVETFCKLVVRALRARQPAGA
jgi:acyl carrier protein